MKISYSLAYSSHLILNFLPEKKEVVSLFDGKNLAQASGE
jgi:hypothetical protein